MNDLRLEVSVDTQLSAIYTAYHEARLAKHSAEQSIHHVARSKKIYTSRFKYRWDVEIDEAIARVAQKIADGTLPAYEKSDFDRAWAKRQEAINETARIFEVEQELNDIFREFGGWSRFFLVLGGHIHSSMECHSCYPTTQFSWLPTLSGLTEEAAVAEHGTILCTHCYPSAPVEWTSMKEGEKPADFYCSGSGKYAETETVNLTSWDGKPYTRDRYKCPGCGDYVSPTSTGKVRKHKALKEAS